METTNNWVKIFTCSKPHLAEMAKQMLENEGFEVQIMNQRDSSYHFGDIHLYVLKQDVKTCEKLIDQFKIDLKLE